jgi:hypothetical protein
VCRETNLEKNGKYSRSGIQMIPDLRTKKSGSASIHDVVVTVRPCGWNFAENFYSLDLWDQNDEEVPRPNFRAAPQRNRFPPRVAVSTGDAAAQDSFPFCLSSLSLADGSGEPGERSETRVRGRRAHFTIGGITRRSILPCMSISRYFVYLRILIFLFHPLITCFCNFHPEN